MGSSESKGQPSPGQHVAGRESQPAVYRPALYRDTEPRVILGNQSGYRVSFWVFEEDKKRSRTKASRDRLVTSMALQLNAGGNNGETPPVAADVPGGAKETPVDAEEEEEEEVYFLTRDHRMEPKGHTQATKIPFPVDCQAMRVCAFFKREGMQQWRLFHEKVYSIGLFKKVFTFIASDVHIAPCIDGPADI